MEEFIKLKKYIIILGREYYVDVESLDLSDEGLTELPENISELLYLENLYLNNNNIEDLTGIEKLTELKELYLSNNNVKDITLLSKLKGLTELYLSNNKIETIKPLKGLPNLNILDISGCSELKVTDPSDFGNINIIIVNKKDVKYYNKLLDFNKKVVGI